MPTAFELLKTYFENSPACQEALQPLKKNIEIALELDQNIDCCLSRQEGRFCLLNRPAEKHDVSFKVSRDAISRLAAKDPGNLAEISVQILKEVKNKEIKISVRGGLFSLLKNGYLEIIAKGGKPVWGYLSESGIASPKKIISIFKDMVRKGSL